MIGDMVRSSRIAALLTLLGVLLVAVFPLAIGPFTATQGPITVFRAIVLATLLLISISSLRSALIGCHDSHLRRDLLAAGAEGRLSTPIPALRC